MQKPWDVILTLILNATRRKGRDLLFQCYPDGSTIDNETNHEG